VNVCTVAFATASGLFRSEEAAMEPLLFYRGRYGVVGPLKA